MTAPDHCLAGRGCGRARHGADRLLSRVGRVAEGCDAADRWCFDRWPAPTRRSAVVGNACRLAWGFDHFVVGTAPAFRACAGCAPSGRAYRSCTLPNTGISAVINPYSRAVRALGPILW